MVAIAALSSCNKELTDPNEGIKGGIPFEITAASVDTKTAIDGFATSWVANDAINLFHAVAKSTIYTSDGEFTIANEDLEAKKFKGTLPAALEAGNYDWYAFYPYSKYNTTPAGSSQSDFGYTTIGGTSQTQTGNSSTAHLCGKPCPLYGVATAVASDVAPSIVMNHLTSIVEVNVTNNSGNELTVSSVSFTGTEDIVGTYYINFTQTPVVYTSRGESYVSKTASLNVADGEAIAAGSSAKFYIAIKPFTVSNGVLKVAVNGYEKEIEISNKTVFAAGNIKKINFNYNYNKTPEVFSLVKTDNAFEDGGKYVLAFKNGTDDTYYFISNAGSSKNLSKSALTVTDGDIKNPDAAYVFTATADGSGFKLANSASKYICNTSSTTLNTNNTTASTWYPSFISASKTYKLSASSATGRYISFGSNATDVKAYLNNNFADQITNKAALVQYSGAISVFKLGYSVSLDPSILADNVTGVSARGLSTVMLTCSVENPVDGLSLSATCDGTVVTEAEVIDGVVLYSVAQNVGEARDGSITLTYGAINKTITVSQLAPVFTVSRKEVELEAAANSSSTITVTSDFDWTSIISTGAGFTSTPTTCEWNTENQFTDGKTTVTITASAANESEEGTKTLGTLTFTNSKTSETLVVTVTQKSSYVAPSTGTTISTTISDYISSHSGITVSSDNTVNSIVKELTLDSNITVSAVGTGNTGSFWGTSPNNDWRIYSKSGDEGTVTISASNSKTITSIKVTFSTLKGGGLKLNGTALTSGTAVTVNTSSVSLTVPYSSGKTGQARITAIEVSYN